MNDPYVYYMLSIVGLILCPVSMIVLKAFSYSDRDYDYDKEGVVTAAAGSWAIGIMYSIAMVLAAREFYKASLVSHEVVKYGYYWFFTPHIIGLWIVCGLRREVVNKAVAFIGRLK
jgi:hypothetical protein